MNRSFFIDFAANSVSVNQVSSEENDLKLLRNLTKNCDFLVQALATNTMALNFQLCKQYTLNETLLLIEQNTNKNEANLQFKAAAASIFIFIILALLISVNLF